MCSKLNDVDAEESCAWCWARSQECLCLGTPLFHVCTYKWNPWFKVAQPGLGFMNQWWERLKHSCGEYTMWNVGDSARNSVCWIAGGVRSYWVLWASLGFQQSVGGKKICSLGACCLGLSSPVCSLNNLSWWGYLELIWSSCPLRAGVAVSKLPL